MKKTKILLPLALLSFNAIIVTTIVTSNMSYVTHENVRKQIEHSRIRNKASNEIVIYNCADYIDESLIKEFEKEYNCKVRYYTYDTNETMYNQFTLQVEGTYDLICASDYMIQRMVREGLVEKINIKEELPVYDKYASLEPRSKLADMYADTDEDGIKDTSLDEYSAGYMWGTLGIVYDPNCSDTIREDVKSWDIFWDEKYEDLISVKNSMRDTIVVGLMHAYKHIEEKENLTDSEKIFLEAIHEIEKKSETETEIIQSIFDLIITEEDYQPILEVISDELISLKNNIFGFEVDSGKNDIITGKIKMNLAWSGDAVYSIDTALDEADKVLEYSVPEEGSNVWYDGWTLPKGSNREYALKFIDFLSEPENAARNMDYIGYTTFIACDEVFDLASDWYGVSEYHEGTYYYGPYYDKEEGEDVEGSIVLYNGEFYQCLKDNVDEDENFFSPENAEYWEKVDEDDLDLGEPYDVNYLFATEDSDRDYVIYPYADSANQLETQYPSQETLSRCAVMNDFEDANDAVVIMWGQIRAYTSMLPYYLILIATVIVGITVVVIAQIKKRTSYRYKRSKNK